MTQSELICIFPRELSIPERALLISPFFMPRMIGISVQECRVFLLIVNGNAKIKIRSKVIDVGGNALVDMLVWEPVTFIEFSDDLEAWCLLPNYMFTNESLNGLKPADSESFKDKYSLPVLPLTDEEMNLLCRQMKMLSVALSDFSNIYRVELCQTYFRSFMLETGNIVQHKALNDDAASVESRKDMIVRNFLKLVWRYYMAEHNVDFYAKRLCLSSKHLSRVVKDSLGKSPYAVIQDEIAQQAMEMLKMSKKSIQEISSELNFSETSAFCKFFKKRIGMSPKAYRISDRNHILSVMP